MSNQRCLANTGLPIPNLNGVVVRSTGKTATPTEQTQVYYIAGVGLQTLCLGEGALRLGGSVKLEYGDGRFGKIVIIYVDGLFRGTATWTFPG